MINDPRSHLIPEAAEAALDPTSSPWSRRPEITLGLRIVQNGCVIWVSAKNVGPSFTAPPEAVATTIDQAVERFRDMLTKVWPQDRRGGMG